MTSASRYAIVGSRDWPNLEEVRALVRHIHGLQPNALIVSGGAEGVDRAAQEEAERIGMRTLVFLPDWKAHGRRAGFVRNEKIVQFADYVLAFQWEESRGTQLTIDLARKHDKPLTVFKS